MPYFISTYEWIIILRSQFDIHSQMLKRISQDYENDPQDDYRYQRDKQVVSIRKQAREEIFRKRRHDQPILSYEEVLSSDDEKEDESKNAKIIILDTNFKTEILELVKKKVSEQDLQRLLDCIQSEDILLILEGVIGIRKLLATKHPPTMQLIGLGIHKKLIELTDHKSPQIRLEALWSLVNVASGDNGECAILIEKGALNSFLRCLQEEEKRIVEQGVWGIGNIVCDSVACRDVALKEGAIHKLSSVAYRFQEPKLTEIVFWAITNICRMQPYPKYKHVEEGLLSMCCMINSGCIKDEQNLLDCLVAISKYFVAEQRTQAELKPIFQTEVIINVIEYTLHANQQIAKQALVIIGNLLTGNQEIISFFLKLNILDFFLQCLRRKSSNIRSSVCWALSNIVESCQQHVATFLAHKQLLDMLLDLMVSDEKEVKVEILTIFANMGENCCEFDVEDFYVEIEIMGVIIELLNDDDQDIIEETLKNLFNILQRADCKGKLQKLTEEFKKGNGLVLLHHIRLQPEQKQKIRFENQKIIGRFFDEQDLTQVSV